jgi:hypothetical protein
LLRHKFKVVHFSVVPPALATHMLQVALLQNTSSLDVALARNASTYNTGELDISQLWNVRLPRLLQMYTHQPSSCKCCNA